MADTIKHQGIVKNIVGTHVFVSIIQTTACSSCSAKGYCASSESKEKMVEITTSAVSDYQPGDQVDVIAETSMGMMAVLWAFIIPFFILVISLFIIMYATGGDELLSSSVSLGLLIPYYLILWTNKERMKKNFSFTIKPIK